MDLVRSLPGGWTTVSIASILIAAGISIALDTDGFHAMAVDLERSLLGGPLIQKAAPAGQEQAAPVPPPNPPRQDPCGTAKWHSFIAEAARRFDLMERWIEALLRAESAGCVLLDGRPTTSTAGAIGLMQLMPKTWELYQQRLALGTDPHDPRDNILAGTAYLRDMYDRFGWPGAAAAYHAGPARYSEYLSTGRPLPLATLEYVARINRILGVQQQLAPDSSRARRSTAVLDSPPEQSRRAPSVGTPDGALNVDPPVNPTAQEALFVPLRHGTRSAQPEPKVPTDVQQK